MNTSRVKLINCDQSIFEHILEGDEKLSDFLKINIAKKWSEFGASIFEYVLTKIKENPDSQKWWTYLPILIDTNMLIGSCGYKGEPDDDGMVELGYEVAEAYRNQGYATEITGLLVEQAFNEKGVTKILAHTLAEENASVNVLRKCNFKWVAEIADDEEGKIWRWELFKGNL
jgi:ribosomal-protein-alanine N-acetyltransferase